MSLSATDLRQTARALLNQPTNSILIVLVLALGMAGVIAMLSIIKSMVWNPLPYPNAEKVVNIGWRDRSNPDETEVNGLSGNHFLEWQRQLAGKATLAGAIAGTISISDKGSAERYNGAFVTRELFTLLGVAPIVGRDFTAEDDAPGAPPTVMLSHSTWRQRFSADPNIVGRQIRANAQPATIIGVMPENFGYPRSEEVWMAARIVPGIAEDQDRYLVVLAEVFAGGNVSAVTSSLESWMVQKRSSEPTRWKQAEIAWQSMGRMYADPETLLLLNLMLATCGLVLLVACANAANLMLARTLASSRDLALRLTLGASRWRVSTLLLAQSLTLAMIALVIAIPLAQLGIDSVLSGFSGTDEGPPPWMDFSIDLTMVLFAGGVAVSTALFVGMLPVMRLRTDKLGSALRDGGRSVAGGGLGKLSRFLVVGELAMACIVLLATVVMVRGVERIGQFDLGIEPTNLLTARVALFEEAYPSDASSLDFITRLTAKLRENPGVVDATAATTLPGLMASDESMLPEGFDAGEAGPPRTRQGLVDPHFASTYGVELRAGRFFETRDTATSDPVIVIDQTFADPQVKHLGMSTPMKTAKGEVNIVSSPINMEGTARKIRRHTPKAGEHTEEILRGIGITDAQMKEMRAQGVI